MVSSSATPLWRNGPKEKPVLCNACGSRYRLWKTLDKYLPKICQPEYQQNNRKKVKGSSRSNLNGLGGISLWNCKIPSRKRSRVVYKPLTPMEMFQRQLLNVLKYDMRPNELSSEEDLLLHNVNSFIPSNEIGLGGILLKPDHGTASALKGSLIYPAPCILNMEQQMYLCESP